MISKISKFLREIPFISITSDLWTSPDGRSFITVTCSGVNGNFEEKNYLLSFTEFPYVSHTAKNIAAVIKNVIMSFNIPFENVVFAVTDSGANMIAAVQLLKRNFQNLEGIRCSAHQMNLVVDAIRPKKKTSDQPSQIDNQSSCSTSQDAQTHSNSSNGSISSNPSINLSNNVDNNYEPFHKPQNGMFYLPPIMIDDTQNQSLLLSDESEGEMFFEEIF